MAAGLNQYLRKWSVMINGEPFIDGRDGHQLRCVFDINVSPQNSLMRAEIQLYNLKRDTVINQRSDISFSAGYEDNYSPLFVGTITNIMKERHGSDVVTRLFCRNSRAESRGWMHGAYGPGAHVLDVLKDAARSWPLYLDVDPAQFDEKDIFPSGWTANPDIQTTLHALALMFGFYWLEENGALVITRINKERTTPIVDVNQYTGMVGMPELIGIGNGIGVEVTTKINPFIRASSRINVRSEYTTYQTSDLHIAEMAGDASADGEYNVFTMDYFGDSHGSAWDMRIRGFRSGSIAPIAAESNGGLIWGAKVAPEFRAKVREIAARQNLDPNWYMAVIAFETGRSFSPSEKNKAGSGATGLIQFTEMTARDLGTSTSELANMTAVQQLTWVEKYFDRYFRRIKNLGDMYMAVFMPERGIGMPDSAVLIDKNKTPKTYNQNSGLDKNRDGKITRGEAIERIHNIFTEGKAHTA